MSAVVQEILKRIESLGPADRAELEMMIVDQLDKSWDAESAIANRAVVARGIDPDNDDAIQRLVDEVRYEGPRES